MLGFENKMKFRIVTLWCAVYLPEGLNVVGTVGSSSEIRQIELNLVPSLIESHWHGADEWLDTGGGLVVGGSETTTHVLVIEYLHFEGEVFLQLYLEKGMVSSLFMKLGVYLRSWWSWQGKEAWWQGSCCCQLDRWWSWWTHWFPWFREQMIEYQNQ